MGFLVHVYMFGESSNLILKLFMASKQTYRKGNGQVG